MIFWCCFNEDIQKDFAFAETSFRLARLGYAYTGYLKVFTDVAIFQSESVLDEPEDILLVLERRSPRARHREMAEYVFVSGDNWLKEVSIELDRDKKKFKRMMKRDDYQLIHDFGLQRIRFKEKDREVKVSVYRKLGS